MALRELMATSSPGNGEEDEHVADLSRRVRALIAREEQEGHEVAKAAAAEDQSATTSEIHGSVEEQEETEKIVER